jgi:hypothetical protein
MSNQGLAVVASWGLFVGSWVRRCTSLLLTVVLIGFVFPTGAQDPTPELRNVADPLPAVLEVVYGGVELRRGETAAWLPLTPGAVMPTGDGDSYRTDGTGRALITLPNAEGEMLILPNTAFTLTRYAGPGVNGPLINTRLERGEVVVRLTTVTAYTLQYPGFPAVTADTESRPLHFIAAHNETSRVFVAGRGAYTVAEDRPVSSGTVVYDDSQRRFQGDAPQPHPSPASVIGIADGCAGTIVTTDGQGLNARTGPSTNNVLLGQFPDGAEVQVMGVVEAGGWVRVQFRSGFGWVERLAIELEASENATCPLPILPNDSFDLPRIIFGPTLRELDLLGPFYGNRRYDPIFYREPPS